MTNIVKLSDDGRALCSGCGATLECSKVSGDMPMTCPVCGGGGDYYNNFSSIEELVAAVSYRLTAKEIQSGILLQLTTFNPHNAKEGYVEKHWQNMTTCAYQRTD